MLKPGMFISDRYEIIDNVGSGGMADVYKAKCHRLNRFVAIKVLKPEYSSDKSFVNKFRGEAQSAAGLSHPNIVNVYDVGDDGGLHYIVMELVEGITLKRFIEKKGKLGVKEAVGIAIQIAQGMEAAHDNHIIHRDIKPQNIIISRDGKVKVTDFGIAKATNSNTITSNAMGSVHYLSPEQARGGYSDEKSDIYSLGVTLYEMLSGKVPFAGDNNVSVALAHIQGEPMPLRELDPSIPVSIDKIVMKCMQKRSERRYHSASELIVDLKRAIANPDGDFVQIPSFVANDSPTINISDDLDKIKNGSYHETISREPVKEPFEKLQDDDEDLDSVDTKMEKVTLVIYIIAIVVMSLLVIFLIVKFVVPKEKDDEGIRPGITVTPEPEITNTPTPEPSPTTATYKFPSVVGLKEEHAKAAILAKDPDAFIRTFPKYSDDYETGEVMEQYPEADKDWIFGDEVHLTISMGAEEFEIPYVYYLSPTQAKNKLESYGLVPIFDYVNHETIAVDTVITTDPPADSMVVKGQNIKVFISLGPYVEPSPTEGAQADKVVVPLLIDSTEEQAKQMLDDVGLVLGNVKPEASTDRAEGLITYQSTSAGEKVNAGTAIDITVSSGPPDEEVIGDGVVKYTGALVIDINPFDYYGEGEDEFVFEMVQDDWTSDLLGEPVILSVTDFSPSFTIRDIESDSGSIGYVTMYMSDVPFTLPGQSEPYQFLVTFTPMED